MPGWSTRYADTSPGNLPLAIDMMLEIMICPRRCSDSSRMLLIVILRSFSMRVATPTNSFPAGLICTDLVLLSKSVTPKTSLTCLTVLVTAG